MNKNNNEEKRKFNDYVTEIITLKEKLSNELKEVEKLKKKLSHDQEQKSSKNRIKFILKDNKLKEINKDEDDFNYLRENQKSPKFKRNSQENNFPISETLESTPDAIPASPYSIGEISMKKKLESGILLQQRQSNDNTSERSRKQNIENRDKSNTSKSSSISSYRNPRK